MVTVGPQHGRQAPLGFLVRNSLVDLDLRLLVCTVWASLLTTLFKDIVGSDTIVFIGSYNLTIVEPVLLMQAATLFQLARRRALRADITTWLLLGIAAIIFINLGRGIAHDLPSGLRSFRIQGAFALYLLIAAFAPRDETLLRQLRDALIVTALLLAVLVALRLVLGPQLFIRHLVGQVATLNDGGRPVTADGALIIGAGLILAISRAIENVRDRFNRLAVFAIPVLLVALVLTAQATAIIASLAGAAIVAALHPSASRGSRILLVGTLTLAGGIALLALNGAFGRLPLGAVPDYFQHNLLRRASTFEFRRLIWAGLLRDYAHWSTFDQLFGLRNNDVPAILIPRGEGYRWDASIHSMYYGALVFMGAVGLALYAALLGTVALRGCRRILGPRWSWTSFGGAIPLGLLVAFSLFGYSYELRDEHAVLILIALIASRPVPDPGDLPQIRRLGGKADGSMGGTLTHAAARQAPGPSPDGSSGSTRLPTAQIREPGCPAPPGPSR